MPKITYMIQSDTARTVGAGGLHKNTKIHGYADPLATTRNVQFDRRKQTRQWISSMWILPMVRIQCSRFGELYNTGRIFYSAYRMKHFSACRAQNCPEHRGMGRLWSR